MICQIYKIKIINNILLHFQRYHRDILLKICQAINAHINDLNIWFVKDIKILIEEINMIKEIKIVSEFKYITKFEYQKMYNITHSIEKYCRNIHDWNIMKDNMNILIYWHISKIINVIININDFSSSLYQIFRSQNNINEFYNLQSTRSFNFRYIDSIKIIQWELSYWETLNT